ncbi:MAG TPA: hypothetical protein VEM34_10370 [Burkholderiales bacterium]|nr:hypothetical protein [Burkholderiales bacterium]
MPIRRFIGMVERERKFLGEELTRTQKIMPLLMKPRNGERWTSEEKRELVDHLKRLSGMGPYVALLLLPGGFALLPLLAWWLDRRRERRPPPPA